MGKRIVIITFLVLFGWAAGVYLSRDTYSLRKNFIASQESDRSAIQVERFTYRRYDGTQITGRLSAEKGYVLDPNVAHFEGGVRAERFRDGEVETIKAHNARATFNTKKIAALFDDVRLTHGEVRRSVKVELKNHVISTDYAEFSPELDILSSSRPVRVIGPGRTFTGREGFQYLLTQQIIEIFGEVDGVVTPDAEQTAR